MHISQKFFPSSFQYHKLEYCPSISWMLYSNADVVDIGALLTDPMSEAFSLHLSLWLVPVFVKLNIGLLGTKEGDNQMVTELQLAKVITWACQHNSRCNIVIIMSIQFTPIAGQLGECICIYVSFTMLVVNFKAKLLCLFQVSCQLAFLFIKAPKPNERPMIGSWDKVTAKKN